MILGLVRTDARSGYEIKALVDRAARFFWAASYSQIYPELKRLSGADLIEGIDAPTGKRRRTVYRITPAGETELKAWLRQPPVPAEMRDEGLLKLFFGDFMSPAEPVRILRGMRAQRIDIARHLRAVELSDRQFAEEDDPFPRMVLQGGIELTDWFINWCERTERDLLGTA